ncbi:MAG: MFS transporter [Actinomycetales bacterium]|nr:MFS transporter [Actinomycetales bacterium]
MSVDVQTSDASRARRREQRGWYFYDWASSAFSTTVITVFLGPYLTSVARAAAEAGEPVTLFGLFPVTVESYFPYVVSASVILQVLVMPFVGALADRSSSKKTWMAIGAYVGAGAVMGMFFLEGTGYQLGGILFVIANVAFGTSLVVYNSYLPDIAEPDERDGVSARGWALGYAGGIILLIVNLALFLGHDSFGLTESMAVRISLLSAGAWWAIFSLIPLSRLRRGRATATGIDRPTGATGMLSGFRQLGHTLRELPRYPQALLFLVAFFFFNDGIQTVIGLSATYAQEELGLPTTTVIVSVLVVQVVGIGGALIMGWAAGPLGAKRVVLASIALWAVMVFAAYLIPAGVATLYLVLAACIGFVLGGSQALARSLFAQLVPRDREAEYFSLYEVSSGASSILGPLIFAVTLQFLGSYRVAILALVVFFAIGGVLLSRLNVRRGQADVARAAAGQALMAPGP